MPISLAGLPLEQLETLLPSLPRFRVRQIYKWITRGVSGFDQMTDIPLSLREELPSSFSLYSSSVKSVHKDRDAAKTVIALKDGLSVEAVLLSDGKKRKTACLSTQAGCPAGCVFCKTGLEFIRNLESYEIVEQFLHLRLFAAQNGGANIDNIVIMGMGEPLLNLENLRGAVFALTDGRGINLSRRRITVSTCGICDGLFDIARNGPYVRLALSLTTADESLRRKLMPVTAANPLEKVKEALSLFQKNKGGRVTLEAVMLGGVNTRSEDAVSLANFAKGLDTVVNLIPWNPVEGLEFEGKPLREPDKKEIEDYVRKLESLGLKTTTRLRKGRKVMGACGQLGMAENTAFSEETG